MCDVPGPDIASQIAKKELKVKYLDEFGHSITLTTEVASVCEKCLYGQLNIALQRDWSICACW